MTTLRDTKVHFLKLVEASTSEEFERPLVVDTKTGEQRALFAGHSSRTVIFVNASNVRDQDIRTILEATHSGTVLDVRVAPRFDIGNLNRGKTFELFESFKVEYVDYCGVSGIRAPDDAKLSPNTVAAAIKEIRVNTSSADHVLCILLDGYQLSDQFVSAFMDEFADEKVDWDVLVVPQLTYSTTTTSSERRLVFISHAAPEDNQFASWLAARLKVAGYEPWLDLGELKIGEAFWTTIENTIKDQAAIVLVIASKAASLKDGVLNEIHLATTLERTRAARGFIIPIKVDDISSLDMPIQLQRRQYVDFSRGWAEGLRKLLGELHKNKISRQSSSMVEVSDWFNRGLSLRSRISDTPEDVIGSWLPITRMPAEIYLHESPYGVMLGEFARRNGDSDPLIFDGKWCTFTPIEPEAESTSELFGNSPTIQYLTEDWLTADAVQPPGGPRGSRRGKFVDLLRRSLERRLEERQLKSFALSGRRNAWFFEHNALPNNKVAWVDSNGKSRKKNLVGYSPKKSVYWHLAIELKPTLWPVPIVVVKLHVIFSANGRIPLGDAAKMHALRRRFCKSWWNENWRDLMLAALFELSKGSDNLFESKEHTPNALCISSSPLSIRMPFSIIAADAIEEQDDVEEVEDQLADDEEWTNEDFEDIASDPEARE